MLDQRLGDLSDHYGIVVGVADASGRRVVGRGHFAQGDTRVPDGDTLFELGSITKVFTSLLLAISVERGELGFDDPLVKHLPPGTTAPSVEGRQITLRDLATHTSGLPREPPNLNPKDPDDPYANYTVEMMYAALARATLEHKPGTEFAYSNLGAALLARALMVRTNATFAELVRERITVPLHMSNTWVDVPAEQRSRLAPGHTMALAPAPYRTRLAMIGNGGVISSANDMLTFLSASMGLVESPLGAAFRALEVSQHATSSRGTSIGLGWQLLPLGSTTMVWHNGGTSGFRTMAAYEVPTRRAVVILSNVFTRAGVDDMAYHLLLGGDLVAPGSPQVTPTRPRVQIALDPSLLGGYVGDYQLTPSVVLSITRDAGQLFVQLTGQSKYPVFPESERVFFLKIVDATLTFELDGSGTAGKNDGTRNGKAVAVVLHQNGKDQRAPRLATTGVGGSAAAAGSAAPVSKR